MARYKRDNEGRQAESLAFFRGFGDLREGDGRGGRGTGGSGSGFWGGCIPGSGDSTRPDGPFGPVNFGGDGSGAGGSGSGFWGGCIPGSGDSTRPDGPFGPVNFGGGGSGAGGSGTGFWGGCISGGYGDSGDRDEGSYGPVYSTGNGGNDGSGSGQAGTPQGVPTTGGAGNSRGPSTFKNVFWATAEDTLGGAGATSSGSRNIEIGYRSPQELIQAAQNNNSPLASLDASLDNPTNTGNSPMVHDNGDWRDRFKWDDKANNNQNKPFKGMPLGLSGFPKINKGDSNTPVTPGHPSPPKGGYYDLNFTFIVPVIGIAGVGPTFGLLRDKNGKEYLYAGPAFGTFGGSGSETLSTHDTVTTGWNWGITVSTPFGLYVQFGSNLPRSEDSSGDFGEIGLGKFGTSGSIQAFYIWEVESKTSDWKSPGQVDLELMQGYSKLMDRIFEGIFENRKKNQDNILR